MWTIYVIYLSNILRLKLYLMEKVGINDMKVVILAGGYGTRISEESHLRPKPMIEIGGYPILWHIMKIYSYYGFNEFIICCGYKGYMIKEYFADYYLHRSDVTFDFTNKNEMIVHNNLAEPWRVTLIDTGLDTMTGGRLKRVRKYIGNESFMLTYGDGVCDVNIKELVKFHESKGGVATLTAIQPGGRFGVIDIDNTNSIKTFAEKSKEDGGWINGGYMVVEPEIFEYLEGDNTFLEREPLERLARENKLSAYKHDGFWQCMDTQRDKEMLEKLWKENKAKWKVWN
ncbi:Glucose-1-phosphate cytidylyltransferase [Clostridium neonatale]|nr:Glucose-1-phosphate cytidylyltransferase [Clostridium neonatale]